MKRSKEHYDNDISVEEWMTGIDTVMEAYLREVTMLRAQVKTQEMSIRALNKRVDDLEPED